MQPLAELLTRQRTVCRAQGPSKKRVFDTLATIIADDQLALSQHEVFTQLIAREKLGSTGLGHGIAIPHCRLSKCTHPIGTLMTLADPVDFDAPDGEPVDLMFALLVPEEAQQQHLDILASVARLFSQEEFCSALRAASADAELHDLAVHWTL
ncbi:MAG: PTS IIA-like nitrogen regulatory protein PtsN [Pseudomonadota bacterium]